MAHDHMWRLLIGTLYTLNWAKQVGLKTMISKYYEIRNKSSPYMFHNYNLQDEENLSLQQVTFAASSWQYAVALSNRLCQKILR